MKELPARHPTLRTKITEPYHVYHQADRADSRDYTAVPLHKVEEIRAEFKKRGIPHRVFYVGPRRSNKKPYGNNPNNTMKKDANYAKFAVQGKNKGTFDRYGGGTRAYL